MENDFYVNQGKFMIMVKDNYKRVVNQHKKIIMDLIYHWKQKFHLQMKAKFKPWFDLLIYLEGILHDDN